MTSGCRFRLNNRVGMQSDDLNCSICFRIAKQAVECQQNKCRKLYCKACYLHITKDKDKELKCPFCRTEGFPVRDSPLREKISNQPVKCKHCREPWKLSAIENHEKQCPERNIKCRFCSKVEKKKNIAAHTRTTHSDKMNQIVHTYHLQRHPIHDPREVLKVAGYKPDQAHLGKTGKFYCNGNLGAPNCNCCNGKCGPTNGENCRKCMQLDVLRRGLVRGYLVHAGGQVCWVDQLQHFSCGTMYSGEQRHCGTEGYCNWCKNIQKTRLRYQPLLEES